jgi:hypothetical protein
MNATSPGAETPDGTALLVPSRASRARIMSCPTCGEDLTDEAFTLWCPACQCSVSFASVIALGGDS